MGTARDAEGLAAKGQAGESGGLEFDGPSDTGVCVCTTLRAVWSPSFSYVTGLKRKKKTATKKIVTALPSRCFLGSSPHVRRSTLLCRNP